MKSKYSTESWTAHLVPAADHASPAVLASRPVGAFAAEVRVGDSHTCIPKIRANVGGAESCAHAALFGHRVQEFIGLPKFGIARHAEHFPGGLIMRLEHFPPVNGYRSKVREVSLTCNLQLYNLQRYNIWRGRVTQLVRAHLLHR